MRMIGYTFVVAIAVLLGRCGGARADDDGALAKAAAAKAAERRAAIQKSLAAGTDVLKRFRIDSLAADGPRIKITGVFLELGFPAAPDPDSRPPFEMLQDELREVVRAAVKDVTGGKQLLFDFSGVLRVEPDDRLFPRLQTAVAARPALDGVRIDVHASFGAAGEFLPGGIRPRPADAKERAALEKSFDACYRAVLTELGRTGDAAADRYRKIDAGPGAGIAGLAETDTRKILTQLRDWAKNNRDDFRFARLYFGPDGGLKLLCETPTEEDVAEVRDKLKEFAPEFFPDRRTDTGPPAPAIAMKTIPSFTPFLQRRLAADPKKRWSTVLIERGYFDETDRFTIRGVIDRKEQKAELAAFVASFESDTKWKPYFTGTVALALDVIAMDDLVGRVQRVVPAYAVFDGIGITGAHYDRDATLVFTAQIVGKPKLDEARILLAELLAGHPEYSRRVSKGGTRAPKVRVEALPDGPATVVEERADPASGLAIAALAKGDVGKARRWVETGILHHPNDATVWFASAYYHHLKGDRELVRRDLLRMIAIEGGLDSVLRKRRFEAVKDLQGEKRDELEKIWLECWKESKDGAKPLTLVPAK